MGFKGTEGRAATAARETAGVEKKSVGAHPRKGSAPTPCSGNRCIIDGDREVVKSAMKAALAGDPGEAVRIAGVDPDGRVAKLLTDVATLAHGGRAWNEKYPDRRESMVYNDKKDAAAHREAVNFFNGVDADLCDDAETVRKLIAEGEIEDLSAGSVGTFVSNHGDDGDERAAILALLPSLRGAFANWRRDRSAQRDRLVRYIAEEVGTGREIVRG